MNYDISHALRKLYPEGAKFVQEGNEYSGLKWVDERPKPSEEEIQTKLTELRAAEPMRVLREERNRRIALTDWRFRSDLSPSQEWKDYCVALRNLPQTYSPTFDILTEDGYPILNEQPTPWPKEPNDG